MTNLNSRKNKGFKNKENSRGISEIRQNIMAHDRVFQIYDRSHGEIFNPLEQKRLCDQLKSAVKEIKTETESKKALDYGCGSGNVTKNLIHLGFHVVGADVSENFLRLSKERFGSSGNFETLSINGYDLSGVKDSVFDLVVTYSVLHHIPNYMHIIKEFIRVTKPGGLIYLDHELSDSYWKGNEQYKKFLKKLNFKPQKDWKRFLNFSNYIIGLRKTINKRYQPEGDIHVYRDDHIEWDKIENLLLSKGYAIVKRKDYLLFRQGYSPEIYRNYENICSDMTVLIARRN